MAEPDVLEPADDASQADEARAVAAARVGGAARRGRQTPAADPPPEQQPTSDTENPYTRFGTSPDDGIDLHERFRLNAVNSFYRGTLAGSARMTALAALVKTEDAPDTPPEVKKARDAQRQQYAEIVGDLARYDLIAPWGTTAEAAVALAGSVAGSLPSPESFVGVAAKGATALVRTGKAALQQGAIQAAVDPAVQGLSIYAGTEQHFDPTRWMLSAGIGAIIGGGIHIGGELVGNIALKRTFTDLAAEDPNFFKPDQRAAATETPNAVRPEPDKSPAAPAGGERPAETPTGPATGEPTSARPEQAAGGEAATPEGVEPQHPRPARPSEFSAKMYSAPDPLDLAMRGELNAKTADEIADRISASIKEVENEIFGGDVTKADEWRKLYRQSNRAWDNAEDAKARALDAKIAEIEKDLPPAAQDFLNGEGWPEHSDADAWKDLARNLSDIEFGREDAIRIASHEVRYLPKTNDWSKMYGSERNAAITVLSAMNAEQAAGRDVKQFLREVFEERIRRYGGGADAHEVTEGQMERLANLLPSGGEGVPEVRPQAALVHRRGGDGEMYAVAVPEGEVRPTDVRIDAASPDLALTRQSGGRLPQERRRPETGTPPIPETATAPEGTPPTGTVVATVPDAASPAEQVALRSLQQQTMDLADALDFPLRQGRMNKKPAQVLGIFKSRSGVVRVREIADLESVAHEAGHYIEAKVGKSLTALTDAFGTELAPLVSNPAAYDPSVHVKEGFAEFIRRYIGNPAHAEQVAPGFTIAFRNFMEKNAPDILRTIDGASAAYRAYIEAPSVDAVGAVIRSQDEGATGWRRWLPKKLQDEGFPVIVKTMMQDAYTAYLDRNAPVARAVREMVTAIHERTGAAVDLKAADNPDTLMRLFARSQQAAVRDMMDGVRGYHSVTPEGPSLGQALAKATGNPTVFGRWNEALKDSFSTYLIARRADVLWERFTRGDLPNPPTAFSRGDARVAMAELERANPQFREASDMVHAWTRQLLKKQFDGGLIGRDLYEKLLEDPFYVPFMRDLSDKPLASGGGQGGGSGAPGDRVADTVQRLRGSTRDIKDPIESLMMQAFLVNRALKHNDIIKSFVSLADRAGLTGGKYVEKIPAMEAKKYTFDLSDAIARAAKDRGMTPEDTTVLTSALADVFGEDPLVGSFFRMEPAGKRGEPIVFYKDGGELQAARFMSADEGHALYETLTELPQGISDLAFQMLSTGASFLRGTIVTNPVFALTNYIRDQVAVGVLRTDYVPFVTGMRGIGQEVRQADPAKLYGYAGGVSAGASVAPLEQAARAEVDALAKQGYLINRLTSLHGLLELSSITEAGTRNSVFDNVFKQKKAQGLSDYEAMIEAAYQSQDILDFSRWGSKTLAMRRLTPFVNAHLQGLDKAYRTLIEPLYREAVTTTDDAARRNAIVGLTKVLGVGGALGAAWAALHHADEIYQDAKPELKGTHFVTTIGNKVFVIPKPFELSLGFTAGEFAYQRLMKDDPRAAEQFAEAAYEVLKPPLPVFENPIIKTGFELKLGKSSFFGRDIVPEPLQRLDAGQQYTDRTSSLAKSLGQAIGVSPIKIDYGIGAMFGLWGRDIMAMSSGVDERSPAQNWEDRALARRFIKDPTRTSDVTTQFWKFMGQTTGKFNQAVATFDFMNKSFRDDDARDFLSKLPKDERAFVVLRSAADDRGKPAFTADEKRLFPLQRAYDAVALLNGMRRELSDNSFKTYETGEQVKFTPRDRRDLIDNLRELAQVEMRNAFVIMKTPGWANRPLMDVQPIMDKIRHLSPEVGTELATRYASARIYKTSAVATSYDQMRDELVRNGSQAQIKDLAADAQAAGYEFDGERVRKPQKRRVLINAVGVNQ